MCETLKDPAQSPPWKKKTWDGAKLCGWGICHSCNWCGIAPPPPPLTPPPAAPPSPPPCFDQPYTTTFTAFDSCECAYATTKNTFGNLECTGKAWHDGAAGDCHRHNDYGPCDGQVNFWKNKMCTSTTKTVIEYHSRRRTEPKTGGVPC